MSYQVELPESVMNYKPQTPKFLGKDFVGWPPIYFDGNGNPAGTDLTVEEILLIKEQKLNGTYDPDSELARRWKNSPINQPGDLPTVVKKVKKQKTVENTDVETAISMPSAPKKKKGSTYDMTAVIRILVEKNPHGPTTKGYIKFAQMRDGMTVAEYFATKAEGLDGKWHKGELRYCLEKGFVKLEK